MKIVYIDSYIVVVHKPAGLLVHRTALDRHTSDSALDRLKQMVPGWVTPVHRIDRPTSGLLMFARSAEMARLCSQQFQDTTMAKGYRALVRGHTPVDAVIDYPLSYLADKLADSDRVRTKPPQEAITKLTTIEHFIFGQPVGRYPTARYSLVELQPVTGRKHQLRRHMAHIRHPILGDTTHGDGKQNRAARLWFNLQRLFLIAVSLDMKHPESKTGLRLETSIDTDLQLIINTLRNCDVIGNRSVEPS